MGLCKFHDLRIFGVWAVELLALFRGLNAERTWLGSRGAAVDTGLLGECLSKRIAAMQGFRLSWKCRALILFNMSYSANC